MSESALSKTHQKPDRRIQRTRKMLQDALVAEVLEKGYEVVTVQNITDRANLGRATFYLHYRDKEELMFNTLEALYDDLLHQIEQNWGEAAAAGKRPQVGLIAFCHVQEHYQFYRIMTGDRGVTFIAKRIRDYMADIVRKQMESVLLPSNPAVISLDIVAYHIAGSLLSLVSWWLENEMPYTPEQMSEMFTRLIYTGMDGLLTAQNGAR